MYLVDRRRMAGAVRLGSDEFEIYIWMLGGLKGGWEREAGVKGRENM
jgi:hypothetical protein